MGQLQISGYMTSPGITRLSSSPFKATIAFLSGPAMVSGSPFSPTERVTRAFFGSKLTAQMVVANASRRRNREKRIYRNHGLVTVTRSYSVAGHGVGSSYS